MDAELCTIYLWPAKGAVLLALAVAIIDIRASVERTDVPETLRELAHHLRSTVPSGRFQVAWGDEVEGLLTVPVDVWDLYVDIRKSLGNLDFYLGVGFGDITETPLAGEERSVHELNGTAFKAARTAMERAKREAAPGLSLAFDVHGHPALTRALNGYPFMMGAAYRQMTSKQKTYFGDLVLGYSHSAIATRHGVSQPTVTKVLKSAGAHQLPLMCAGLAALLDVVGEHIHWGEDTQEVCR